MKLKKLLALALAGVLMLALLTNLLSKRISFFIILFFCVLHKPHSTGNAKSYRKFKKRLAFSLYLW